MIKREYKTKEDCVSLFMDEGFDSFPSWVVTDSDSYNWRVHWEFVGLLDENEQDDDGDEYGYVDVPMWGTWFIPDYYNAHWIEEHPEETMDCGFTLIYHDSELFAIGVDGAGYSFRDTHFTRLYDAQGLQWHEL